MASDGLKSFIITGGAAASYTGLIQHSKKRGRRATVKKQEGGAPLEAPIQGAESHSTLLAGLKPLNFTKSGEMTATTTATNTATNTAPTTATNTATNTVTNTATTLQQQQGGIRQIKVELKKKSTAKKVHLQPKKTDPISSKKHLTRKIRKISIGLSSLRKRITHAKKVHTTIKAMPLDKLREHLIQKKLIKATSKAPESILRQIAADSQIVDGKA